MWRKMEALRDRLMFGIGTDEPWFLDDEFLSSHLLEAVAVHWRKPLRIDEVNQVAPTPEVIERQGRP